jgi:hypothetical protein
MPKSVDIVTTVDFTTASELLSALRPMDSRYQHQPGAWVFRGHADASWKLVPSANRRAQLRKFLPVVPEPSGEDLYWEPTVGQIMTLLHDFKASLNRAGFVVPKRQGPSSEVFVEDEDNVFTEEELDVAALAQHHGIPTWLLDWTRYGTFAAYFAASDVVHEPNADGRLAIWALNVSDSEEPQAHLGGIAMYRGNLVQLQPVERPRAGNPNLHAQAGLFTLGRWSLMPPKRNERVKLLPVDDLLAHISEDQPFTEPVLYKFTLPRSEAGALLKWLAHEPVTGAMLFPGLNGVARDVRDRQRWPK